MIDIKPYDKLDFADIQKRSADYLLSDENLHFNAMYSNDAWTFRIEDEICAIVGAHNIWEGCTQIWAVVSDVTRGHGKEFTEKCNLLILEHADHYGIRRFNCVVNESIPENVKWIKRLDFKVEGVMYKAAPDGSNMLTFVRWMVNPEE